MGATAAMVQMEAVGERGKAGAGGAAGQAGSCSPGPEGDGAAMLGGARHSTSGRKIRVQRKLQSVSFTSLLAHNNPPIHPATVDNKQ